METEIKQKSKIGTSKILAITLALVGIGGMGLAVTNILMLSPKRMLVRELVDDGTPGGSSPTPNTPFTASDIISVTSILNLQDNTSSQQYYYLGSTQVYRQMDYQNGLDLGSVTTAQPLSIQIGGQNQAPSVETGSMQQQLVHITYRTPGSDTNLYFTLCLALTNQVPTRVYFSDDGSAFKDSALTQRYITKTCTEIKNQALKYPNPVDLSIGSTLWTDGTLAFRSYMQDRMTVPAGGSKIVNAPVGPAMNFSDPLAVLSTFLSPHTAPYIIPPLRLIVINGAPSGTTTLCYPGVSQNTQAERHPIYFDTAGKPYSDIFLQNQIPCELPPIPDEAKSKIQLVISDVVSVSSVIDSGLFGQHDYALGGTLSYRQTAPSAGTHVASIATDKPLTIYRTIFGGAYGDQEMANLTYRTAGSASDQTMTICLGLPVGSFTNAPMYVAIDGSLYQDSALTTRTTTDTCGAIKSRALTYSNPTQLSGAPSSWTDHVDVAIRRGGADRLLARRDLSNGGLTGFTYTVSPQIPVATQTNGDPLAMTIGFQNVGRPAPYIIPTMSLSVQNSLPTGTTTICIPGGTRTNADQFGPIYFDKTGKPYGDIFLTQAISCTPPAQ